MFKKKRNILKYNNPYNQKSSLLKRLFSRTNRYKSPPRLMPASRRPSPLAKKVKNIFIIVATAVTVIFSIYLVFFSNYFLVKDVVLKNKEIDNQVLADGIKKMVSTSLGQNLFFIDTESLENKILFSSPDLEKVTVSKNYPDTLEIEFSEFPLTANLINESSTVKKTYIINSIGYAVKEDYENPALPYIIIKSDEVLNTKTTAISADKLKYILDTIKYFEDKFGMKVKSVEVLPVAREIHILTEKNFYIWLDIQKPAEEQLNKLKKALVKLDIYNVPLQYIDLRIAGNNGDKIIYKRK